MDGPDAGEEEVDAGQELLAVVVLAQVCRVPGVTLLGDAAHLAPPNGEGANVAMLDGAELGRAIAEHPGDPETALAEYERAMFPRAAAAAQEGADFRLMFADDAPHGVIAMWTGNEPRKVPRNVANGSVDST